MIFKQGPVGCMQVDCTQEPRLCQEHQITGFPSVRVFRKGSDDITMHGIHEHESYRGELSQSHLCDKCSEAPAQIRSVWAACAQVAAANTIIVCSVTSVLASIKINMHTSAVRMLTALSQTQVTARRTACWSLRRRWCRRRASRTAM